MRNRFLHLGMVCTLLLTLGSSRADSQIFPVNSMLINGPTDKRINIVFLSEGYMLSEMGQYSLDVQQVMNYLFGISPYQQYQSYFNVYAIEVPSVESGTDHPNSASDCPGGLPTFYSNTYFNSTFDYYGIHRLLVVQNIGAVFSVLMDNFPEWDIVFIVVNHSYYGGSGGTFATFSMHSASSEVAVHELGHSFPGLADEYDYGGLSPYEAPNATAETTRELIRWTLWIDDTTPIPTPETSQYANVIGLFEGAVYQPTGWYRPKLNCKMRALGIPFCEVCSERTIITCYELLSVFNNYEPANTDTIVINYNESMEFNIAKKEPSPNTVETLWNIDGLPAATGVDIILFDASLYSIGDHKLEVIAQDMTGMVLNDPNNNLEDKIAWNIRIEQATAAEDVGKLSIQLHQNHPNPFNPTTIIRYFIPGERHVRLTIFDVEGRKVKTLVNNKHTGPGSAIWNGSSDSGQPVSSGIYFYRLQAGGETRIKKMVLIK